MQGIRVSGTHLVDENGHEVILNGICFICRDKSKEYLEPDLTRLVNVYARKGFNLLRLGIFWDAVEPEPGVYDERYLDNIAHAIQIADANGIYVFLDMHQDLFSAKFIDGAPAWATLDEGLPAPTGNSVWYDAYLNSPAVIRAADNFWENQTVADGIGLLDHYEAMWEHLAECFQDFKNIIGFEPMNEPYMGSLAPQTFAEAVAAAQKINPDFNLACAATASLEEQQAMIEVMTENFAHFDRETLMPFYERMLAAIRRVSDIPLVIGCNIYGTAVKSGLSRVNRPDGKIDDQQIFAPHGYDAVVDTENYDAYSKDNVSRIFARHREVQNELELPVIVGEWGNFPSGDFTNDLIEFMTGILEQYLWHSTYHQYTAGMELDANYSSLERGYPQIVAGRLQSYHYDNANKELSVRWRAIQGQPSVFYLPDLSHISAESIILTQPADYEIQKFADMRGGLVKIIARQSGDIYAIIH